MTPFVVLTAAVFAACRASAPVGSPALGPVPIEARVFRDNAGGIRVASERVIRDSTEWRSVWQEATSAQATRPTLPVIDFQRNMLLLVSAGRLTLADDIKVDSVGERSEITPSGDRQRVLAVHYTVVRGCPPTTREAFPVEIVRVRSYESQVRFIKGSAQGPGCEDPAGR